MESGPFSYYDFFGILAPGTVLLVGLLLLFGKRPSVGFIEGVGVGGLGILAILGYATGQMTQAFGNVLENVYWRFWEGKPTQWVRTGRHERLSFSEKQIERLQEVCRRELDVDLESPIPNLSASAWRGITGQFYAAVENRGQTRRITTFNSKYGFHRGLTVAALVLTIAAFVNGRVWIGAMGGVAVGITLYRMHRFARHYAHELFVQVLQLPDKP
ncbi:hypothetical protein GGP65_002694 [Salinibacter ruber]|uniref:hypothetical protein n=1 Tax=Salinibacter ruber TaxID=146919 RepID=UPI002167525E|nr:hypothetical protein [Salinibacter ruber]MCS3665060.1 hypothetical protein [Salinibacter ruber]